MWLPSLYLGPNWIRHDGQAQVVEGQVRTISKSSLFLGGTAAAGSSVSGPVPAGGPAQVSGLTSILRFSDAIFEPLAARQVLDSRRAGIQTATNDALLGVAESYLDLQRAAGTLAIAREAATNAEALASLTASYARSGAGLEADHRRAAAERERQRKNVELAVGELEAASAELVLRTRLDPRLVVAPVEPPEAVLRIVPEGCPIDELIVVGLRSRPELAEAQALVQATLTRLRQAKLRPFIPSLAFRYSGGGFGGGANGFFGDFASRSDADVNLYWEIQNLGFADRAITKQRAAQQRTANLELLKLQDRVASEVVLAEKGRIAAARRMKRAGQALPEAQESLALNLTSIRRGAGLPGATRPIEVLQPIQALAQARTDYLDAVLDHNRWQFRLYRALGRPPGLAPISIGTDSTLEPD
ncbi:TolC family protein [Planctomyces sp. SH-PL62]|uniref:TolC family protein n=1 Tax=Planctomyces sp. SH-PL62 TaxID=1636152 RepID=UPI0012E834BD|nr:TolC family protein [Planctomyces sp. SH-PL62]